MRAQRSPIKLGEEVLGLSPARRVRRPSAAHAALLALLITLAPRLGAQEPARDTLRDTLGRRGADSIPPARLPPVVVTVLRTPFELERAPYAVATRNEREVQTGRPGLALDEALLTVPGVQVDNRFNYALGERISIRGFGARAQFGVRGVRVIVDGIPATFPDGQTALNNVDLSSLGRVEVIRGPASAIYGNAAGGVIQLETEASPPVPIRQDFSVIGGEDGLLRTQSKTGGQVGRMSYLVNVDRLAYDGFRDFNEARNLHVNSRVGYQTDGGDLQLVGNWVDYDAQNPGALSDSLLKIDRTQAYSNNVRQRTGEDGRQGQLGLTWRRALGGGELRLAAYGLGRSIDNPIPPTIIDLKRAAGGLRGAYGSRARIAGREAQWIAGAEVEQQRDDRQNFVNEEGQRGALTLDQKERVTSASAFGQGTLRLGSRMSLLGGLRYDHFRFRADDRLITADDPDDSGVRNMSAVSPSVGLSYAATSGVNIYGNVATSFQTPTTTELANQPSGAGGFNPNLDPQRAISYEVGANGRFGGRGTYQVSVYRADIDDALIPFEVPGAPGRQFFRNAGSARHQGVEAEAAILLFSDLIARGAYAFTDARFVSYATDEANFDGNRVPGISPHRLTLALRYTRPSGVFADAEATYASRIPVNDANTAHSPSYVVTNLRLGVERLRVGTTRVTPFIGVNNVFDEEYNASVTINAFGGRYFEPGPGRAFYAGVDLGLGYR
jgi:iron complex outermembrane recepter protein